MQAVHEGEGEREGGRALCWGCLWGFLNKGKKPERERERYGSGKSPSDTSLLSLYQYVRYLLRSEQEKWVLQHQAEELGANTGVPSTAEWRGCMGRSNKARLASRSPAAQPWRWYVTNQVRAGAVVRLGLGEGREHVHSCKSLRFDVLGVHCCEVPRHRWPIRSWWFRMAEWAECSV